VLAACSLIRGERILRPVRKRFTSLIRCRDERTCDSF
jgi:hypothetical protein